MNINGDNGTIHDVFVNTKITILKESMETDGGGSKPFIISNVYPDIGGFLGYVDIMSAKYIYLISIDLNFLSSIAILIVWTDIMASMKNGFTKRIPCCLQLANHPVIISTIICSILLIEIVLIYMDIYKCQNILSFEYNGRLLIFYVVILPLGASFYLVPLKLKQYSLELVISSENKHSSSSSSSIGGNSYGIINKHKPHKTSEIVLVEKAEVASTLVVAAAAVEEEKEAKETSGVIHGD